MSFIPLATAAIGAVGAAAGAAAAPPASPINREDYNPVTNINDVQGGDLNGIASLVSAINAGNSYNGGMADAGVNTAPAGGGIAVSGSVAGFGSSVSDSFNLSPTVLLIIGGGLAFFLWFKYHK